MNRITFADIVDGELKAIKPGILAAKTRLDQTNAPAEVREEAKEIADEYEQRTVSEAIVAPVEKSGRKISSANEAKLKEAMDHHASASQCIKDVLDSNAADDSDSNDPEPEADDPPPVAMITLSAVEQRIAEARALKASLKI